MQFSITALLVSFLPVLTLGVDSHDSESERFLYFPSVFVTLLLTEVVFEIARWDRLKIVVFSMLLLTEIFYLSDSAGIYQVSSSIAKLSMKEIGQLDHKSDLYCIDLPSQYRGGFIFRTGFKESADFLTGINKTKIKEVSKREISAPSFPYAIEHLKLNGLPADTKSYFLQEIPQLSFLPGKEIVLRWTDSSLQVFR
jgi:hypothetical protein